ncbi:squalene--hopene cyclase [Roseiconus nitratireducens]|uniref:Squalene--hopene cyclase n=1 Tax=Roseiconus nitratireducens TaxID=2605748 RepID=A0A5M6DBW3_9BACT|nr:squalene--hopene cyclase [Roseiconus nitratireducens]
MYAVAIAAIVLLAATVWLFRRTKRDGRGAGIVCLILSVALHVALLWLVPYQAQNAGGSSTEDDSPDHVGVDAITFSTFESDLQIAEASGYSDPMPIAPLPVHSLQELLAEPTVPDDAKSAVDAGSVEEDALSIPEPPAETPPPPAALASTLEPPAVEDSELAAELDSALDQLLKTQLEIAQSPAEAPSQIEPSAPSADPPKQDDQPAADPSMLTEQREPAVRPQASPTVRPSAANASRQAATTAAAATVPGETASDFANRVGSAKQIALAETGGDAQTEAAVRAALRFLAESQRDDGSWDPRASGAGVERMPLGEHRFGAGTKSTHALTGLALLTMMGAGNTHLDGDYKDNVYRGLSYLIQNQNPDGSLSGDATLYAASYCHSMAALALCEAAVMTRDASAVESSRRAVGHTIRMQHPVTGGWRYTRGDPGDLSQLGWQAMVLDAARRAGVAIPNERFDGIARFLHSVRAGSGGLASYRPGEAASRTMTAEALATRLLIGEAVPQREIDEAERYLLDRPPGTGQDNYYCWYYATIALHQLQDDAWQRWNAALKRRLLSTQRPDGSWPAGTVWGGYGGTIYTTSMAALCLQSYYRHTIRGTRGRVARAPGTTR